ncbi:MAG: hypothetical protein ACHQ2E_07555 [Gemmatimonadales bacterium]
MTTYASRLHHYGWAIVVAGAAGAGLTAAAPLAAQNPNAGQMAEQYAQNAKANAQLMHQYTWQMRVSLSYKGEDQDPMLYQMNWDASGNLQKTLISAPPEEKKRHGIRKHVAESEISDFKKWMSGLMDLVKQYMTPNPGQMMDFYSKATITPSPSGGAAAMESGFIQAGDKVTFFMDPATKQPTKFTFETTYTGDPVSGTVNYAQVPGGPKYASQTTVNVPAKQVITTIENFNFVKQ